MKMPAMVKRFVILTLAALFLSLPVFVHAGSNTEDSDFTFAKKAFNDGFYDIAESRLETFLRDYPETQYLYEAHTALGRCYYYRTNYQRALYEFGVVLNAPAGGRFQDEALYWTGEIYLKTNDPLRPLSSIKKWPKIILHRNMQDTPSIRWAGPIRTWVFWRRPWTRSTMSQLNIL